MLNSDVYYEEEDRIYEIQEGSSSGSSSNSDCCDGYGPCVVSIWYPQKKD